MIVIPYYFYILLERYNLTNSLDKSSHLSEILLENKLIKFLSTLSLWIQNPSLKEALYYLLDQVHFRVQKAAICV